MLAYPVVVIIVVGSISGVEMMIVIVGMIIIANGTSNGQSTTREKGKTLLE